jgi:phosphohistidine phosphatase SixA
MSHDRLSRCAAAPAAHNAHGGLNNAVPCPQAHGSDFGRLTSLAARSHTIKAIHMHLIVLRHGQRVGDRLTRAGEIMSLEAGAWLAGEGLRPARVVTSTKVRTMATARLALEAFPDLGPLDWRVEATPRSNATWLAALERMAEGAGGDVLAVVHGTAQRFVETHHGGAAFGVPSDNRAAAFILVRESDGAWRCNRAWAGR